MRTESVYDIHRMNPIGVREYLRIKGWKQEESAQPTSILYFHHPDDVYAQLELPFDPETTGFVRAFEEVIFRLSEFEKRPKESVVSDLLNPDDDIVRYRVQSGQAMSGTISLVGAQDLISTVVQTWRAAVCDVVAPRLYHPRLQRREIDQLLEKARFAQTERGSYVVKILCPVHGIDAPEPTFFDANPVARQVTSHLMKSVHSIVQAVELGKVPQFIDDTKRNIQERRISTNFCRAIADMQIWEDASVEISTTWAPLLPCDNRSLHESVRIKKHYFTAIYEIAEAISPPPQEMEKERFVAIVDECRGTINQSGEREGDVVLDILTSEGEHLRVKTYLSAEQYKIANECHIEGEEHYLSIKGTLRRGKRTHQLINIVSLTPIDPICQ